MTLAVLVAHVANCKKMLDLDLKTLAVASRTEKLNFLQFTKNALRK
jgi:hypothetical protein